MKSARFTRQRLSRHHFCGPPESSAIRVHALFLGVLAISAIRGLIVVRNRLAREPAPAAAQRRCHQRESPTCGRLPICSLRSSRLTKRRTNSGGAPGTIRKGLQENPFNLRAADARELPFAARCLLPKACCQIPQVLSLAHGQLLEESGQSVADGLDRVGVVGVVRRALFLEVGPLIHNASPFDVGIANEFFQ